MLDWIDLVIIGVIAFSVITGLIRGFVKELIALGVWIMAIWLAFNYSQAFDPWLQQYIQDKSARSVVGFSGVMLTILVVGGIVNVILGFFLKRTGLSGTDCILGMAFGFVRGVFIIALIMTVLRMTSLPYQQYTSQSRLYAKFEPVVNWMSGLMPDLINRMKLVEFQQQAMNNLAETSQKAKLIELAGDLKLSDE